MEDNNFARVKSNKWASDDDAADLLSGILNETEDEANAEQARIEAALLAKTEARAQEQANEESRKREEAEAKLSAELDRLQLVDERRTQKIEALKIEDLKDRGEWVDPEEERRKLEEARAKETEAAAVQIAAQARAEQMIAPSAAMPAPAKKSSPMMWIGLALLTLIALVGAGGAFAFSTMYQVDNTTYSKAVFTPMDNEIAVIVKGMTPIPKVVKVAAPTEVGTAKLRVQKVKRHGKSRRKNGKTRRKNGKTKNTKISGKPKQNESSKALEKMLNEDIFSKP